MGLVLDEYKHMLQAHSIVYMGKKEMFRLGLSNSYNQKGLKKCPCSMCRHSLLIITAGDRWFSDNAPKIIPMAGSISFG